MRIILATIFLLSIVPFVLADERRVDFEREVYPILQRSCIECHGPNKEEGSLRLDLPSLAMNSGTIEPRDPEGSELLRRVTLPPDDDDRMPEIGNPLSSEEIETIRSWIAQGASWPEDWKLRRHWSYLPPARPEQPRVSNSSWCRSPLDYFVLSRLEKLEFAPSPVAVPEKLLRRVFLDLIGLPPTPDELDHFLAKPTSEHLEAVVDELLRRPQFGEKWARHWLDLARYADSHGFQRDDLRDIWAYRDWVIQALNDDMPFDQFTIEQIAGDLLPDATESQRIATGFHRCAPTNVEAGSLPEETRIEQVMDRVNTTGAVWLGTTLECCQCHDHKYDPFTQREYYQLLAFFNSTELEADRTDPNKASSIQFRGPSMDLADAARDSKRLALMQQLEEVKRQQAARRSKLAGGLDDWANEFSLSLADVPRSHVLAIDDFQSEGSTDSYEVLDDGSILLVGGDPPETDCYTLTARCDVAAVQAFRLDVLQHDSLPGKGPGRGDSQRTNFVLNEFEAYISRDAQSPVKLDLANAQASFSQTKWDVSGAIDNQAKSGWAIAPKFDQAHWATFQLDKPIDLADEDLLTFKLEQNWGQARTIGCFRLSAVTGNVDAQSIPDNVANIARKSAVDWSQPERAELLEFRLGLDAQFAASKEQISTLEKRISQLAPDTTLVMIELADPRPSMLLQRGDYRNPGEAVSPGTPAVLHELPQGPPNRLTLARWLASPENPLVARVAVNRLWAELFGQGIVKTVEDFGIKGESPTHPELLDWLAVEFVESGWSMKHLLKTIVMSATYQQSSAVTLALLERDDQNRWLSRGPKLRMDAEMVRDNALAIAGLLSLKQFGPPIRPYQPDGIWTKVGGQAYKYEVDAGDEQYRRGVYVIIKRGSPYPSLINFDATPRLTCTVKRSRTNTPQQALTLLNDPVYVAAAKSLAQRILRESALREWGTACINDQMDYAFRLCTARLPTDNERETLVQHFANMQVGERSGGDHVASRGATAPDELKAWTSIATVLLNLHETITKD